jgi:HlyD family secretion protein
VIFLFLAGGLLVGALLGLQRMTVPAAQNLLAAVVEGEVPFFSGSLETREIRVAAEVGARVTSVRVAKGDIVKAGDRLVELDDREARASVAEAEAAVQGAKANLEQVLEEARPGQVALAEAAVSQAQADLQGAKYALEDAQRSVASPQDIQTQMHTWEAKVTAAQGQVTQAEATLAGIKNEIETAQNDQSMGGKYRLDSLQKQQEAAEASLQAAHADLDGARQVVELYRQLLAMPLELLAAQNNAANQVRVAEAGVQVAKSELAFVRRPPQKEAIALAQARLASAQATLDLVRAQAARYTLESPIEGTIVSRDVDPGETARPGVALLTIADTREYEITIFVPLRYIQAVCVGQPVRLRVPSLGGETFPGHVNYISPEAEFKPANLYNSQERSEMVFAVKATVSGNTQKLKAGLPADVILQ